MLRRVQHSTIFLLLRSSSQQQQRLSHFSTKPQFVTFEKSYRNNDKVISVTFQRADLHNAFNAQMIEDITTTFQTINQNLRVEDDQQNNVIDQPRCVVLTGAGKSFSAGADLNWMKEMTDYTYEQNIEDARKLYDMIHSIRHCKIPVIARVNGSALGGGAGIVAASDIGISVASAKFGFTEVKLGLLPAVISPFVLSKIGVTNASRYFLTGEVMSAQTALDIKLIQSVVEKEEEMDAEIDKIIAHICSSSPTAVRASKNLILQFSRPDDIDMEKNFVTREIATMRVSKLGQDGLRSFLSKTKPSWITPEGKK